MIGIDLGTTNSLVAHWQEQSDSAAATAVLIPNGDNSLLTPSAVSLTDEGSLLVGDAAWQRRVTHAEFTATEFKRDMGSSRTYNLGERTFSPEQLSSLVLGSLKADAEHYLDTTVRDVVVSVPAYFNDTQRKATMVAAELAGLNVVRLINEPTAAALAYGLADALDEPRSTLVFDLGGGTFDISVVDLFEGVIEIKASTGDNYLGGEDFTQCIAEHIASVCELPANFMTGDDVATKARLRSAAERIKRALSQAPVAKTSISIDNNEHVVELSEEILGEICEPLLERIRKPVRRAMRDARLDPQMLDSIVLVGGTTRMPIVRKLVSRLFGRFPETRIHPDHAIALGAATQAALLARDVSLEEVLLTDVSPFSLGVGITSVNGVGIEVEGVFSPIIQRNVIIPASRVESYGTIRDNQSEIHLDVYQGEHRFVKDNVKLGELVVPIPKKKAGMVTIDVRFSYDSSGLLEIDVDVPDTGVTRSLSLLGDHVTLDEKDIAARRAELATLKIHPRDDLPNRTLLERADRLYAELNGYQREQVGDAIAEFAAVLNTQDPHLIKGQREAFKQWLDEVESLL